MAEEFDFKLEKIGERKEQEKEQKEPRAQQPQQQEQAQQSQSGDALDFKLEKVEVPSQPAPGQTPRGGLGWPKNPQHDPQPEESSEYVKGLKRGGLETVGLGAAGASAFSEFASDIAGYAGFESGEEWLQNVSDDAMDEAQEWMQSAQQYSAEVERIEEIDSMGKFISWAAGVLGEQTPIIAGAIASGGIGSVVGKVAAKKALKKGTKEALERKVKNELIQKAGRRGATAGVGGFATTVETGGIDMELEEAGEGDHPGTSILGGMAAGALETIPFIQVARRLGLGKSAATNLVKAIDELPRAKRALATAGLVSGTEAGTEGLQEAIAIAARDTVDENFEAMTEESLSRLMNAAAAGGTVGGGTGFVAGAVGPASGPQGQGLPPREAPTEGQTEPTTPPQQPRQLPEPPIYGEPPGGAASRTGEQMRLFQEPPQGRGPIESPAPEAAAEAPRQTLDQTQQGEFGEFLTPFRTGASQPQILSFGEDGVAREVDTQAFIQGIEDSVAEAQGYETPDLLTAIEQETGQQPIETEIQTQERPEAESRFLQNIRVTGQARRHGKNLQDLIDEWQRTSQAEDSFTKKGQLKASVRKKLQTIETGIQRTAEREKIPNPLEGRQLTGRQESTESEITEKGSRGVPEEVIDETQEQAQEQELPLPEEQAPEQQPQRPRTQETEEVRRRVERRQASEQEQGQTQEQADQQAEEELRRLGIDPDEFFEARNTERTSEDLKRSRAENMERLTEEHANAVRDFAEAFLEGMPGLRNVELIVDRRNEMAKKWGLGDARSAQILRTQRARAFYVPRGSIATRSDGTAVPEKGQILLFPENVPTQKGKMEAEVTRLLMHEGLVHGGLDTLLSDQERENFRQLVLNKAEDTDLWNRIDQAYGNTSQFRKAEEYVAKVAESGTEMPLVRRVVAMVRRAVRKILGSDVPWLKNISNDEIRLMLGDIMRGTQDQSVRKARQALKPYVSSAGRMYDHPQAARTDTLMKQLDLGDEAAENIATGINNQAKIWKADLANLFLTPLQLAKEYGVRPMQDYFTNIVPRWWNTKSEILDEAEQNLTQIQRMGKDRIDTLGRMLFRATLESDKKGRKLNIEELMQVWSEPDGVVQKKGITPDQELLDMFEQVQGSIGKLTKRLEKGLKRNAIRETVGDWDTANRVLDVWERYKNNQEAFVRQVPQQAPELAGQDAIILRLQERIGNIESEFQKLDNHNYFPLMRFGRYTTSLVATKDGVEFDGETFNKGDPIIFETYEGPGPQQSRKNELIEQYQDMDGVNVHSGKLSDEEFSFLGMPPSLEESIKGTLDLTEGQEQQLREIFIKMSPGRSFLKHLLKRKGTQGFSTDLLRVYAGYMSNAAGHLARVENYIDMQDSIREMENVSRQAKVSESDTDATVIDKLRENMSEHFDWIMNPGGEMAALRGAGFMFYLGFNPRSAVVNLTQVPLATYPYLADRYGDSATVREITKAYKAGARSPRGEETQLSDPVQQMMRRGAKEGWIDESLATEVAGYAESSVIQRMLPSDEATSLMNKFSYYGGWMFSHAEQYNRRVAAVAAYNLARQNGKSHEEAIVEARETVQSTQFEYAKWNRAKFMRGKKSIFFLFWQYMQHASYLAAGRHGKGTAMRFWLMLGLAGGLQGLPYAEVIMELINTMGTKFKQMMGLEDPRVDLQEDIRRIAESMDADPSLVMHGLSRYYGLGPLHVASAFGAPVPNVDISGSISMGRFPPGVVSLLKGEGSRATAEATGAVFNIPISIWKSFQSDNPDTWKRWERPLPTALKNASESVRYAVRGEETTQGGAQLIEFDPHDMKHRAEQVSELLGFPSTRKNERMDEMFAKMEAKRYWLTRRTLLMQDFAYAKYRNDREGIADARKAIREFNRSTPSPSLRITAEQIQRSVEGRAERRHLKERGLPSEKMATPLYRDLEDIY